MRQRSIRTSAPQYPHGAGSRQALIWSVVAAGVLGILLQWSAVLNGIGPCAGDIWQRVNEVTLKDWGLLFMAFVMTVTPMACIIIVEWRALSTRRGVRWLLPPIVASTVIAWTLLLAFCLILALGDPEAVECVRTDPTYARFIAAVGVGSIPVSIAGLICSTVFLIVGRAAHTGPPTTTNQ